MDSQKFVVVASRAYEVDCDDIEQGKQLLMEDLKKDFPTECVDLKIIPYSELENGTSRDTRSSD